MHSECYRDGLYNLIGTHYGTCHIIGTGPSALKYVGEIEEDDQTIGLNEAPKFFPHLDYLVIQDPRAISKTWSCVDPDTTIILGTRAIDQIPERSDHDPRRIHRCVFTHDLTTDDPGRIVWYNCGILTGGLSVAVALGFDRCCLHGCDFYGVEDRHYAAGITRNENDQHHPLGGGRYTTPALRAMCATVTANAARWKEQMEIVNMNPLSELRCFDAT